jgi:hypothetical protein
MPKYTLIIKDEIYIVLAQEALRQGKSMGKFLNEILEEKVNQIQKGETGGLPVQAICIVCGKKANFVGYGKGQQKLYVCTNHKHLLNNLEGFGEVKP